MKKLTLTIIISILLVGSIIATGISISNKSRDLDKGTRDIILNAIPENEISLEVLISCSEDDCIWSAYQDGLINTHDNIISKHYSICVSCEKITKDSRVEERVYTNEEIENKVMDIIEGRITSYANVLTEREDKTYLETGNINLKFLEK